VSRLGSILLAVVVAIALAFLLLPLVALFLRVPPGTLIEQLGSGAAVDAMLVSLETSLIAHVVILGVGTPVAWVLATRSFPGRRVAIAIVELPLVLPPAVAGIALLAAFGRRGLLGGTLEVLGITLPFTQAAVVVAIVFVASPFYVRQAIAAFATLDQTLLVALPLASGGLGAGSSLAFARGLGEFGATIIFAGSFRGETQTAPLAIYAQLDLDFDTAIALGALLIIFSVAILIAVNLVPAWARSTSVFPTPFAPSASR
jgi:molybdate transport system permease protein